jgi:carboxynorspermidine decarboxylase
MPDTLEMPYRPDVMNAGQPGELAHTYRFGGMTCLAGDVIDDYSFAKPLKVGDRIVFDDMSHYTMVKTTTFNGINLPSIAIWNSETDDVRVVKQFGYEDFKERLS